MMEGNNISKKPKNLISKKRKYFSIMLVSFFAIIMLLFFTAFSGKLNIVGSVIGSSKNVTSGTEITTSLGVPNISMDREIKRIEISSFGNPNAVLSVGNQVFKQSYEIVLENYDGDIDFNNLQITRMKGKAERVLVNGLEISSKSKKNMKIELDESYNYDFLSLEKIYLKKLNYNTSGSIKIKNGSSINVNNEQLKMEDFIGNLMVKDNQFILKGILEKLEVPGISVY